MATPCVALTSSFVVIPHLSWKKKALVRSPGILNMAGQLKDEGSAGPQQSLHRFDTHFATTEMLDVNNALQK